MKAIQILVALALFLAVIGSTAALPVVLEEVKVDDTLLAENAINTLSLERGQEYEVRVRFTPTFDIKNAEVRVFISGYEFSDVQDIEDRTSVFDASSNVTYVKKLHITIPDEVDKDSYKLRVIISDRFADELSAVYNLQIDVPRNALKVDDVIFSPSNAVRAGSALLTTVRVENKGEKDQNDVKVTVNIPGLGVSGSSYIDNVDNNDEEEETEEIFLRVPKCAKAGQYDVIVDVEFSQRHRKISEKRTITVLEDNTCSENSQPQSSITLGNQMQNVASGQTAIFPITVTNAGKTSKTFTVTMPSTDWAEVTITPTSMLVVPAGQTQTVFVNVQVGEDTPSGAHSLVATVSSGENRQELTLTTTVAGKQSGAKNVFEVILIVLVVLLVVLGIIIGIGHLRGKEQAETYY
jgi:uncharacterized membrane protein